MSYNGIAKNQHYVPRMLLKNFSNEKEQIQVFNKKNNKKFYANIKKIASEKHFYNFDINGTELTMENLLTSIEGDAASVIDKIIKQRSLASVSEDEKFILSAFVSVQLVRTKEFRAMFSDTVKMFADTVNKRFGVEVDGLRANEVDDVTSEGQLKLTTAKVILDILNNGDEPSILMSKKWLLMKAPEQRDFYISDSPVVRNNILDHRPYGNLGLLSKGVEIYLPISSEFVLALLCPDQLGEIIADKNRILAANMLSLKPIDIGDKLKGIIEIEDKINSGNYLTLTEDSFNHQNYLQVAHSLEFVYSRIGDFRLAEDIVSSDPRYRDNPKMKIS